MITVAKAGEPPQFDATVREPGKKFLDGLAAGQKVDFRGREYWRKIIPELYAAYGGICAYTCHWIAPDTGSDTVEHFRPKSTYPNLAYEWTNFRLVCGRLNGRKANFEDVADPCSGIDGWFEILFPSLQISVRNGLSGHDDALARSTIKRLKLNDNRCIKGREAYIEPFCKDEITMDYLDKCAPFLARELIRQDLLLKIKEIMQY
jgi:uncharacterized protein (TIGR02646 family)